MEEVQWFTQQVLACEPSMYRLAKSILSNAEDAADAAQEAILTAYQNLHTLRQRDSFRPWLMKILTRECYAILKQRVPQIPLEERPEVCDSGEDSHTRQLWEAVCQLKPPLRSVVVLYYYEGFDGREIAAILGITYINVKTRLSRARKQLKQFLLEEAI